MAYGARQASSIIIEGGKPLEGRVQIQGSKNAALPVLAASLLVPGVCVFKNIPRITDIECMKGLLKSTGAVVTEDKSGLRVDAANINEYRLPSKYVGAMRSSVVLMGALLGRLGEAVVDYPGGCVIGERPIDLHLYGLERLGAQIWMDGSRIHAYADELRGAEIDFRLPSVGATENVILAAVAARGVTVVKNAAREPEIKFLCDFLNKAGARIETGRAFTENGRIVIHGLDVSRLNSVECEIMPDRIVAGTYLFAAIAAGGSVELCGAPVSQMESVCAIARQMGAKITALEEDNGGGLCANSLYVDASDRNAIKNILFVETGVFPAFPTDLQSPLLAAAAGLSGEMELRERIFSSRFKIVEELVRMGADIELLEKNGVRIHGVKHQGVSHHGGKLHGCSVIARELRGGAALVIAGLAAHGITTVADAGYIHRGYQDIVGDLKGLGANVSERS